MGCKISGVYGHLSDDDNIMINLKEFAGRELSISRSMTDAMWTWRLKIDKDRDYPKIWTDVGLVETVGSKNYCLLRGFTLKSSPTYEEDDQYRIVDGYSYGWFVANRPILPSDRLMRSSVNGSVITTEDPILYLNRLIFGGGSTQANICRLQQGYWMPATPGWGTDSLPYQNIEQSDSAMVQSAIDEISEYTGLIHFDHWLPVGNDWIPVSFLMTQDLIDYKMNLPEMLVIENTHTSIRENQVVPPVNVIEDGTKWKNRVIVTGTIQGTNNVFQYLYPSSWDIASQGLERIYPYCFQMPATISTSAAQALVETRAKAIYSLLSTSTTMYEVKFWKRPDLQLYQRVQFTGFDGIPSDVMRITDIEYSWSADDGDGWGTPMCTIKCAIDRQWAAARKLSLILKQDYWAVADSLKRAVEQSSKTTFLGTTVGYGPNGTAILRSASGAYVYAATPNQ